MRNEIKEQVLVKSQIDGYLNGWSGETKFKLMNGQVWQQAVYAYVCMYEYLPMVKIVNRSGDYILVINGCEVPVKQIG